MTAPNRMRDMPSVVAVGRARGVRRQTAAHPPSVLSANTHAAAQPRGGKAGSRKARTASTAPSPLKIRALSIAVTLGLALLTTARPAAAYVIQALTSISADGTADRATLEKAIQAAVDDIATHAVAFRPTEVSLLEVKLVGKRIYLFVLLADAAGEAEIEVLNAASARPGLDRR